MPAPAASARSPRARLTWGVQVFVLLLVTWCALDGLDSAWIGAGVALAGAAFGAWLAPGEVYRWQPLRLAGFFLWFVAASWRGGVDVARRALAPRMAIDPVMRRHRMRLPAGLPRTLFVGVLSLLPGTLSVALDEAGEVLDVHCLTPAAGEGIAVLEQRLAWLFAVPLAGSRSEARP
jgi:multicomponent Na+:H+ antiporter subunit E